MEENPEEISKFAKIKSQVAEVKGVMKDNIDKVCAAALFILHAT